ncbi:GNAT family N-acetyltransferase [Vibrio sonorensis]|uniref:GNAT family N-acetyltransferase n=1 Tax=Vibrio sonorensis TaxID=1004316 RepID=UPI0008DA1728|nr:GNAT family N-acetyltransferase [Vibrio sonorensis]
MNILVDLIDHPKVISLLEEHLEDMRSTSPPESVHALDLKGLKQNGLTFWTLWDGDEVLGCVALKELDKQHGEIKSMRTSNESRGKGIGKKLLEHVIEQASSRGYQRLSLETGSMDFFKPARSLYSKRGFQKCQPFADYTNDPNSEFMALVL